MWVFYTTCVSKNSVVSQGVIFYLLWYKRDQLKQPYMKKIFFSLIL